MAYIKKWLFKEVISEYLKTLSAASSQENIWTVKVFYVFGPQIYLVGKSELFKCEITYILYLFHFIWIFIYIAI